MPTPESSIYQIKVALQGISPMIWRRLLIPGDSTISDLHYIFQIAMGWRDEHLHQFRIHGKGYGIAKIGGITFSDDPDSVRLKDLGLRISERFYYEYDFTDGWKHEARLEAILAPDDHRHYPVCINGRQACPPEYCGGPLSFMMQRQEFSAVHILTHLADIIEDGDDPEDRYEEFLALKYWLTAEHFDRKEANRRLYDYALGNNPFVWA